MMVDKQWVKEGVPGGNQPQDLHNARWMHTRRSCTSMLGQHCAMVGVFSQHCGMVGAFSQHCAMDDLRATTLKKLLQMSYLKGILTAG